MLFTEKYELCDHIKLGDAFIGANTSEGFHGMFDSLIDEESMKRVYIIKGAAGTGKSTLLKQLYNSSKIQGIEAKRFCCSSDPYSLDLVVLASKIAILDGTAPHTYDMMYPGAASSIIDLSRFWNYCKLENCKFDIITLTKQKIEFYKEAYSKLRILNMLFAERMRIIKSSIDNYKLDKFINKCLKDISTVNKGDATREYHRCISTAGRLRLDTLESKAEHIFKINDFYGSAYVFTERLCEKLKEVGIKHIQSTDPMNLSIIGDIFLPN